MKILSAVLWLLFLALVFWAGFSLTEIYFQRKFVPYPFKFFGIAVGSGCLFFVLAIKQLFSRKK